MARRWVLSVYNCPHPHPQPNISSIPNISPLKPEVLLLARHRGMNEDLLFQVFSCSHPRASFKRLWLQYRTRGREEEGPQVTSLKGSGQRLARGGPALATHLKELLKAGLMRSAHGQGRGPSAAVGAPKKPLFWACGAGARACNQLRVGSPQSWSLPRAVVIRGRHKRR